MDRNPNLISRLKLMDCAKAGMISPNFVTLSHLFMKPYPLFTLNHFTVPVTLVAVKKAQTNYVYLKEVKTFYPFDKGNHVV